MVQFDECDLFYKDYENSTHYPDYIAIEDLNILNIRERYHVVYFCDAYLKRFRLDKETENFQKAEYILKTLPERYYKKQQLFNYVSDKWDLIIDDSFTALSH